MSPTIIFAVAVVAAAIAAIFMAKGTMRILGSVAGAVVAAVFVVYFWTETNGDPAQMVDLLGQWLKAIADWAVPLIQRGIEWFAGLFKSGGAST